ncbi:hypothetical protein, partial [Pseudovibrio sp. W74]|uniref:hypothetical protein n=1 Tax=Pseudovibrio sp. W74 TaxID=1735584 RepID=UPI0019D40A7A
MFALGLRLASDRRTGHMPAFSKSPVFHLSLSFRLKICSKGFALADAIKKAAVTTTCPSAR